MKKIGDLFHALRGLDDDAQYSLQHARSYLDPEELKHLEYLLKYRQVVFEDKRFPVSERLLPELSYPEIVTKSEDKEVQQFASYITKKISDGVWHEQFIAFGKKAKDTMQQYLASHILGMETIKHAAVLQLVMPERFHILLLGDPGTGKTDILRAASDLAHKSSFGLGSGASKAGLSVSVVGKEIHEGLLVQANGGLCCIDELNLMKADDRAALYNAMEKGFISYDKGQTHERFDADIRLLATANPSGDQFRGNDLPTLKRQLPFDSALLSRFHLVFLVRTPDVKAFREISKHALQAQAKPLSKEDFAFIHEYIKVARDIDVHASAAIENVIVDAVTRYKKQEKQLLTDVTARLTKGLLAMTKAQARISMRTEATQDDARVILAIVESSFPKLLKVSK